MEELVTMMAQVMQRQQTLLEQQQIQHRPKIEIANYQDGEDIESFLETFEGIMRLHQVQKQDWVIHLIPKLQGRARDACAGLTYKEDYETVKTVLKRRFDITTEGCRRRFRSLKWSKSMTPEEYTVQVTKLADRWLTPDEGMEQVKEKVVMEQMIEGIPVMMRQWIMREEIRGPTHIAELMQRYITSERMEEHGLISQPSLRPTQFGSTRRTTSSRWKPKYEMESTERKVDDRTKSKQGITCYKCGQIGHISKNCSKKSFGQEMLYRDQLRKGTVNGISTDRIVLDTGASTTIVHQRMVSEKDYTGDAVTITDSGGTTRLYPKARVTIQLQGDQTFSQEVAVSEVVPEDVLLGRDAPIGVPLLATFPRQVRKAMWEKMN